MNKDIIKKLGFEKEVKMFENNVCPTCCAPISLLKVEGNLKFLVCARSVKMKLLERTEMKKIKIGRSKFCWWHTSSWWVYRCADSIGLNIGRLSIIWRFR